LFSEQFLRGTSRKLSDFQGVGQAIVEDMSFVRGDDLRNTRQPTECGGVEDSVAISLPTSAIVNWAVFVEAVVAGIRFLFCLLDLYQVDPSASQQEGTLLRVGYEAFVLGRA
jgi:hypothetical protein